MEHILSQLKALPALPEIVYQLTALIDNPNSTAGDLAKVISIDQSLTARLLRLVNSSYYAFRSRISKVSHAISLIGFNAIKNIVLSLSLIDAFRKREKDEGLDGATFWEHSIGVASAARTLAEKSGYSSPEEAFVAGLIHDIGKVVYDMISPSEYRIVLNEARTRQRTVRAVEKEYFGYGHAELGGELARSWNLPEQLRLALMEHHDPQPESVLARIVSLADTICKARMVGNSGDYLIEHIPDDMFKTLDISKASFMQVFSDLGNDLVKAKALIGISRNEPEDVLSPRTNTDSHSPLVLIASRRERVINVIHMVLSRRFRTRPSSIPIRMTRDEKQEVSLIIIDAENDNASYPEEVEIRLGEAAIRRIPAIKLSPPFNTAGLLELVSSWLKRQALSSTPS